MGEISALEAVAEREERWTHIYAETEKGKERKKWKGETCNIFFLSGNYVKHAACY